MWVCIESGRPRHNIVKCRSQIEIPLVRASVIHVAVATVVIIAVCANVQGPASIGLLGTLVPRTICVSLYDTCDKRSFDSGAKSEACSDR